MRKKKTYIGVSILQSQPTAVVNADETGAPKTAHQGGCERLRLSSQCWKRAMRKYMKDFFDDDSVRTNSLRDYLARYLQEEEGVDSKEAVSLADAFMKKTGITSSKDDKKDVSTFFNVRQIERMKNTLSSIYKAGQDISELKEDEVSGIIEGLNATPSTAQLFFGRMFASNPSLDYDSCCSVAHAISVGGYEKVFDLFTNQPDDEARNSRGAAFLDTKILGSGLLYRYANLDLSEDSSIVKERTIDEAEAASQFIEAFSLSFPEGGKHEFAPGTVPERIVVEIRTDRPINYNPAFDEAISGGDIKGQAEGALDAYREKISRMYGAPAVTLDTNDGLSLAEICKKVKEYVENN